MPAFKGFKGINNVQREERLEAGELTAAVNVDIDETGAIMRRLGSADLAAGAFHSLYEGPSMTLAVRDGNLVRLNPASGATLATIVADIGARRVSYQLAPNGRVYLTNGVTMGSTNGTDFLTIGVPRPPHIGNVASLGPGELFTINVAIGYKRQADGLEGGLTHGIAQTNGTELSFVGLPQLDGYDIVAYAAPANHQNLYRLGTTSGETFGFRPDGVLGGIATWDALGLQYDSLHSLRYTEFLSPPPYGSRLALWNGRLLLAAGRALWASRPYMIELFDLRRDYKMFLADITMVRPVQAGIWISTTEALHFLRGNQFDGLALETPLHKPVAIGSDAVIDGSKVKGRLRSALGQNEVVVCIADGRIAALSSSGTHVELSDAYEPAGVEYVASIVEHRGYPQYLATPIP